MTYHAIQHKDIFLPTQFYKPNSPVRRLTHGGIFFNNERSVFFA